MIRKVFLFALIAGLMSFMHLGHTQAAFVANDLIDDGVFDNSRSMSSAQIDSWLNTKFPNSCLSTNNGFSSPDPTGFSPATGFTYGGNVSAGRVISDAAQAYGLNPQVILATLEKESSVVSGNASYHCTYINTAMGYDCPDAGSCPQNPAKESGFSKQVIYATWMLKFHEQRSEGNINWNVSMDNLPQSGDHWDNSDDPQSCYGGRVTQGYRQVCPSGATNFYDGYTTIDGTTVHLDTGATAALYDYTPHFHGNQLFVGYFEQWFGSTKGELVRTINNGQVYIINTETGYKYAINNLNLLTDYSTLGLRYVDDAFLSQYPTGQAMSNMFQGPDGSLYLVNAGIKLPFSSCSGDVVDYGFTCAGTSFNPLTAGQTNKLVNGPGLTKLVKSNNNGTIYYMAAGQKRPFISWNDLTSLNIPISYNVLTSSLVNSFSTGSVLYGPGSLVKTQSSGTVYVVKNTSELFSISSFVFAHELGITSSLRTMTDATLNDYTLVPGLQNIIQCNSNNYVGINGNLYLVSATMMDSSHYNFNSGSFLPGSTLCLNLGISNAKPLIQYIRTPDGTIYYVSSGQKQAFTSYSAYLTHQNNDGSPGYILSSDYFASSLPSGANISS